MISGGKEVSVTEVIDRVTIMCDSERYSDSGVRKVNCDSEIKRVTEAFVRKFDKQTKMLDRNFEGRWKYYQLAIGQQKRPSGHRDINGLIPNSLKIDDNAFHQSEVCYGSAESCFSINRERNPNCGCVNLTDPLQLAMHMTFDPHDGSAVEFISFFMAIPTLDQK